MINISSIAPLITYLNPRLPIKVDRFHSQQLIGEAWRQYRKGDTGSSLTGIAAALREQKIHADDLYQAQHIFGINLVAIGETECAKLVYGLSVKNCQLSKSKNSNETKEIEREFKILKDYPIYLKGLFLTEIFKRKEAVAVFKELLGENPDFILAHVMLAENYFALGEYQEALNQYTKIINLQLAQLITIPTNLGSPSPETLREIFLLTFLLYLALETLNNGETASCLLHTVRERIPEAKEFAKKLFDGDPETFKQLILSVNNKFIVAYNGVEDYSAMIILLENLLKLTKKLGAEDKLEFALKLSLSQAYKGLGRYEKAKQILDEFRNKFPYDRHAMEFYQSLMSEIASRN
jgi:tetratricopeptide (TPR) repeat protein